MTVLKKLYLYIRSCNDRYNLRNLHLTHSGHYPSIVLNHIIEGDKK